MYISYLLNKRIKDIQPILGKYSYERPSKKVEYYNYEHESSQYQLTFNSRGFCNSITITHPNRLPLIYNICTAYIKINDNPNRYIQQNIKAEITYHHSFIHIKSMKGDVYNDMRNPMNDEVELNDFDQITEFP